MMCLLASHRRIPLLLVDKRTLPDTPNKQPVWSQLRVVFESLCFLPQSFSREDRINID